MAVYHTVDTSNSAIWIIRIVLAIVVFGSAIWFFTSIIKALNTSAKRERESKIKKKFRCGTCYYTYREDLLANENITDGKVCRFCWEKKLKEKDK